MRRAFLAGLIGIALAACASAETPSSHRFAGTWDWHFETSSFRTDSGEGPYWLVGEGDAWERMNAPLREAGRGPWGQVHLVVEGELGPPGRWGHLGAYERELRVTRVIEARVVSASAQPQGS